MAKERVQTLVDPETMQALRKMAEKEDRSVSWVAGRLLDEVMGRKKVAGK